MMAIIHSLKCTVPSSFAVPLLSFTVTHCHSLSLFVTLCYSLSLVVPLLVTRCTIHCHSLPFAVTVTPCYSMYHPSVFNSQLLYDLKPMAHLTKTSVSFLLKFTFFKTKRIGSLRSFIKDKRVIYRVTASDNEWYNE